MSFNRRKRHKNTKQGSKSSLNDFLSQTQPSEKPENILNIVQVSKTKQLLEKRQNLRKIEYQKILNRGSNSSNMTGSKGILKADFTR